MRAPFRVVVIPGASSGLGAALALLYAGPGVAMGLLGRNPERLAASAAACRAAGAAVDSAMLVVPEGPALGPWLEAFANAHPVELLIANAGTSAGPDPGSPGEPLAVTQHQLGTNLLGAIHTIAPLVPRLCARGRGRIVAVASIAAFRGLPYSPGYCASKAGLRAYAEAVRSQLASFGRGVTGRRPCHFPVRAGLRAAAGRPRAGRHRRRDPAPHAFSHSLAVMGPLELLHL